MKSILPARRHATQAKRFNCHLSGCLVLRRLHALHGPYTTPLMLATNTHGMKTHYGEMLTDKTPSAAILLSLCIMRRPERRKDISPVKLPLCNWVVCVSWQPNTFPYNAHCEVLTPNKNKAIERTKRALMNMLVGSPFSSVCLSLCLSLYVSLPYALFPTATKF